MKLSLFTDVGVFYCLCLFSPFVAGRYHSLVIEKESFPDDELVITAWTEDGLVMAARHKKYKHLQVRYCSSFSPIFFPKKKKKLRNFLFTYYVLRETIFSLRGIYEGESSIGLGKCTLHSYYTNMWT